MHIETTRYFSNPARLGLLALAFALGGCSALGGNGPTSSAIRKAANVDIAGAPVQVIEFDARSAATLRQVNDSASFATMLGNAQPTAMTFAPGDGLAISVYEAPPALLFGPFTRLGATTPTAATPQAPAALPPVVVDGAGYISVPFVGRVQVAGLTPSQVAAKIQRALVGKANSPQVLVSETGNTSRTVTVLGETGANLRVPLSSHGERLLDVLASAQTLKQPVDKTTVQIARGSNVVSMPLQKVIADPAQNIRLAPDDVVTALYKPFSFTALGSIKANQEVEFEATGISLAQALGRVGGLDDRNANVRGVFVFRFEDPRLLPPEQAERLPRDPQGRIPVIYRLDMSQGVSLLLAQQFAMRDKDVIYVSRAPLVDLQNFVGVASQLVYTIVNVSNGLRQ